MELIYFLFMKNTGWVGNILSTPHISNSHSNSHFKLQKRVKAGISWQQLPMDCSPTFCVPGLWNPFTIFCK